MCILCVASRWSRRIVTLLPWLVIPLIILWALSQLLPPGFRFEVTSPRLACVFVLLISLGWYEILMPRLSSWRARRSALMRERRRIEALEAAKWRKEATRRCRNCLTAYRDQNPAGGRFMCTYCGHVSRRPVLDIPGVTSGIVGSGNTERIVSSGITLQGVIAQNAIAAGGGSDLGGKNVRVWNGKGWPDRGGWSGGKPWMGGQPWSGEWSMSNSWLGGSWLGMANYWGDNAGAFRGVFGGGEQCSAAKSYSGVIIFLLRIIGFFFFCIRWIWKKVCRGASSGEDGVSNGGRKAGSKKVEDGFNSQGNKGEKARRKAEEKRQARLEKEMLEEEERKQREEVARLVEERRRLRDEKLEAEKESEREAAAERERESRREREAERRRQEKVKEREKGLGKDKSHTDGEDSRKRNYKEAERKCELDKKGETEKREAQKTATHQGTEAGRSAESLRVHGLEPGFKNNEHGMKGAINSAAKVGGSRYLDHMKGSFLSPYKSSASHANNVTSFWGKGFRTGSSFGMKSSKTANFADTPPIASSDSPAGTVGLQSTQNTGSAWNRMAWTKVWGKGSGVTSEDVPRQQHSASSSMGDAHCGSTEAGKPAMNNTDRSTGTVNSQPSDGVELQRISPATTQTKSWQRLFTSPSASFLTPPSAGLGNQLDWQHQSGTGSMSLSMQSSPMSSSPSHICFGSSTPVPLGPTVTASVFSNSVVVSVSAAETSNASGPTVSLPPVALITDETDPFEDPSYAPDPISLLGPVSESLDNFPLDLGTGLSSDTGRMGVLSPGRVPITAPVSRPAPIESPASKMLPSGIADEVQLDDHLPQITEPWGLPSLSLDGPNHVFEQGKWQMWDTPQLGQGEIVVGEPSNWLLSLGNNIVDQNEDFMQPLPQRTGRPLFKPENHHPSSLFSPQPGHGSPNQSGRDFMGVAPISSGNSLWLNQPSFESAIGHWDEPDCQQLTPSFANGITEGPEGAVYDSVVSADGNSYEHSSTNFWLKSGLQDGEDKNNWSVESGTSSWSTTTKTSRPHIGGIYTTPDVQSVWSYK